MPAIPELAGIVNRALGETGFSARFLHRQLRDRVPLGEVTFRNCVRDLRENGDLFGGIFGQDGERARKARKDRAATLPHLLYSLGVPKSEPAIAYLRENVPGFRYPPGGGISLRAMLERHDGKFGAGPLIAQLGKRLQSASPIDVRSVLSYVRTLGY